jgi:ankyrin repeat protein
MNSCEKECETRTHKTGIIPAPDASFSLPKRQADPARFILLAAFLVFSGCATVDLPQAIRQNNFAAARAALDRGADPNVSRGRTPLIECAYRGNAQVAHLLLDRGADVDGPDNRGFTPLVWAVSKGHLDVARTLIKRGARVAHVTHDGVSAIHYAAALPELDFAKLLLDNGAPVDSEDKDGATPLMYAACMRNAALAQYLIGRGASIGHANKVGETALHYAAAAGDPALVALLLPGGASPDAAAATGTPLMAASRRGCLEVVDMLLAAGADPCSRMPNGVTALHEAVGADNERVAGRLLQAGVPADCTTGSGLTPLQIAAAHGDGNLIRLLLDHGAAVNHADKSGYTALMAACHSDERRLEVVRELLQRGASTSPHAADGHTAFSLACRKDNAALATFLIQNGAVTTIDVAPPEGTELNAKGWHLIADNLLASNQVDEARSAFRKAGNYYGQAAALYDSQVDSMFWRELAIVAAAAVGQAAVTSLGQMQADMAARDQAKITGMAHAGRSGSGLHGYHAFMARSANSAPVSFSATGPGMLTPRADTPWAEKLAYARAMRERYQKNQRMVERLADCLAKNLPRAALLAEVEAIVESTVGKAGNRTRASGR